MNQLPITVICGLVRNSKNQYLVARRASHKDHAGYWEFPGGKLEIGETHQECLKRELLEELGMQVTVGDLATETIHQFKKFTIHLIAYDCEFISASFKLTDHDAYKWIDTAFLSDYTLIESDIAIAEFLQNRDL